MSVIAVQGLNETWKLRFVKRVLTPIINGDFETMFFDDVKNPYNQLIKTCYLKLSDKLNPVHVIDKINSLDSGIYKRMISFIPEHIPDIPFAPKSVLVPKPVPYKDLKLHHMTMKPRHVMSNSHYAIMYELQIKYNNLSYISSKLEHKLMEKLNWVICERLMSLKEKKPWFVKDTMSLTRAYRDTYHRNTDFDLVASNLHEIEEEMDKPLTEITEDQLNTKIETPFFVDGVPYKQVKASCAKYSAQMMAKLEELLKNLDSEPKEEETEQQVAERTVRAELKNMVHYLHPFVKESVSKRLLMEKNLQLNIRIYCEPSIPKVKCFADFINKFKATNIQRDKFMYNLLLLTVPYMSVVRLLREDGIVVDGSKLMIRLALPKDTRIYRIPTAVKMVYKKLPNILEYNVFST